MSSTQTTQPNPDEVRDAIKKLTDYKLHARVRQMDHQEAHRILPVIWPVIQDLCLVADACEAGMIEVKL